MDCRIARQLLDYDHPRASELDTDEAQALTSHLQTCSDCEVWARAEREADRVIASAVQDVMVPAGLRERLLVRLQGEHRAWYRRQMRTWGSIAAALLIVCAGLAFWASRWRTPLDAERLVAEQDGPGETAEQVQEWFYANCRVKTVLPTNFKYGYLVSAGLQDFKGRLVPRLLFKNGSDFAEVLVLSTKQFELPPKDTPMTAPGSRVTVELMPSDQDVVYLVKFSPPSRDWLLAPEPAN
jgi:hypothetical protein